MHISINMMNMLHEGRDMRHMVYGMYLRNGSGFACMDGLHV